MRDNISLIAAATGGFMLSVALSGMLHGMPVTSLKAQMNSYSVSTNYVNTENRENQLVGNNHRS
ncbi:hypothetical protein [Calothrix sp. 336/3]|uniref:hypothetical protein n=1 Tax=Calothrix sp. 336/3 TaxID=1337936 RepID=UPI00054E3D85|nr:hypothetical protein [Calothrix sp. 336/3]AKG21039.1 hypothetical protein IJ00_06770 [Calothrix sp. 336/3]